MLDPRQREFLHKEISEETIGAAFDVYKHLLINFGRERVEFKRLVH